MLAYVEFGWDAIGPLGTPRPLNAVGAEGPDLAARVVKADEIRCPVKREEPIDGHGALGGVAARIGVGERELLARRERIPDGIEQR